MKTKTQPYFSVIIPCYNAFAYLGKLLDSLENQTFKDFEAIFIDDCSTDETFNTLLKHKSVSNLDIKVLKKEINQGAASCRTEGVNIAKGNYLLFLDSDDWYEINLMELVHEELSKKDSDIVLFDSYRCFSTGKRIEVKQPLDGKIHCSKKDYLACAFFSLCAMSVKASLFENVQMPQIPNGEDIAVTSLLMSKAETISYIDKPLYNYLYRRNSISNRKNKEIADSLLTAYKYICENIQSTLYSKEVEFIGIKIILYGVTLNAFQNNFRRKDVRSIIDKFIVSHPNWHNNIYISNLPFRKRIFLRMLRYKNLIFVQLLSKLHRLILNMRDSKDENN